VNRALKIGSGGNRRDEIGLRDLGSGRSYHNWIEAARLYHGALRNPASAPPDDPACPLGCRVLTLRVDGANPAVIDDTLLAAYQDLDPGDMLIVDIPEPISGRGCDGSERDLISRALFKAGFDRPMIWAGRKMLEAENRSSLGVGPSVVPGVEAGLKPRPNQLIAIARRSVLAPPSERTLRLSVILPVFNEKDTFCELMEKLLAKTIPGFDIEICMVESNSTDGTRDDVLAYAHHPRVRVVL
jgi:Glycosyl transferase family 2